jgi:hypothetical protein
VTGGRWEGSRSVLTWNRRERGLMQLLIRPSRLDRQKIPVSLLTQRRHIDGRASAMVTLLSFTEGTG